MSKQRMIVCLILILWGSFPLINSLINPRLQSIHGSDRVQLIAVGLCFGVGFGVLMGGKKRFGD